MEFDMKRRPVILLADDDEDLLLLMKMKMKSEGFAVQTSPNGEKIYDMVETNPPDIILLDITMRGIDGADICKHLKTDKATRDIPVVLFSANYNIQRIAKECGADDCIDKPFDNIKMKDKLLDVLNRSHHA
jgi:CheY-like chemotaxis protein